MLKITIYKVRSQSYKLYYIRVSPALHRIEKSRVEWLQTLLTPHLMFTYFQSQACFYIPKRQMCKPLGISADQTTRGCQFYIFAILRIYCIVQKLALRQTELLNLCLFHFQLNRSRVLTYYYKADLNVWKYLVKNYRTCYSDKNLLQWQKPVS